MQKWILWTVGEAGTKTMSKILQKIVGIASQNFGDTFFATAAIGLVQVISALLFRGRKVFFVEKQGIIGSVLFGVFATISTVLAFLVFTYGGQVGTNTFIITLSIVPGALADVVFFKRRLIGRQWLGVFVAVAAGFMVMECPSLQEIISFPLWVWLSFAIMLSATINQVITQLVSAKVDPMANNFWGGGITLILCFIGLAIFPSSGNPSIKLLASSGIIGVIVVAMWSFNLLAYKDGAYLALKKLVLNSCYLAMATIAGLVFFGESFSFEKGAGFILYVLAFALLDKKTGDFLISKVGR